MFNNIFEDDNVKKYIQNDILVTHLMNEKVKAYKLNRRITKLSYAFGIFAFVTVSYISALISNAREQNVKIENLTETIKELTSAKGE